MRETMWNGGYFKVGETIINCNEVRKIKSLEAFIEQQGVGIFDRKEILSVETECGKIIEIEKR